MKKILLSLLTIAAVAIPATTATYAYFNSSLVLGANTVATGTIEIKGDGESFVPFQLGNLKPGDKNKRVWLTVKNTGTLDIDYLTLSAVNKTGEIGLLDKIMVTPIAELGPYDANRMAYFSPDWGNPSTSSVNSFLNEADILNNSYYRTAADKIAPGQSYILVLDFSMPTSVDSYWMGKTANFDLKFIAEQVK